MGKVLGFKLYKQCKINTIIHGNTDFKDPNDAMKWHMQQKLKPILSEQGQQQAGCVWVQKSAFVCTMEALHAIIF